MRNLQTILWAGCLLTALASLAWFLIRSPLALPETVPLPVARVSSLQGPVIATMDSPVFVYEKAWRLSEIGADPSEPAAPWQEPAGSLRFTYTGSELALLLATGDYWGYLYITVDDQPANLLPTLHRNENSLGQRSGYRTLYAPEQQSTAGPTPQWVRIHRAAGPARPHEVYIEIWRSWEQIPLRAVAVDALPTPPLPRWPGVALLLLAAWLALAAIHTMTLPNVIDSGMSSIAVRLQPWLMPPGGFKIAPLLTGIAILLLGAGSLRSEWRMTVTGLLLLAWCGLQRPGLWLAALLVGLPFYYSWFLPILPMRTFSLIDIGILGGIGVLISHWWLVKFAGGKPEVGDAKPQTHFPWRLMSLLLAGLVCWALLSTVEADRVGVAFREWRTVFLNGGLFAFVLVTTLRLSNQPEADQRLLLGAWVTGAAVVAVVGLWQYVRGEGLITAEGVERVRAFYGSPNNLALYLERALALLMALALFGQRPQVRGLAAAGGLILGSALLLTFSKGALLFGAPAMLIILWIGGFFLLRQRGQSRRLLWAIAGIGVGALLALTPFLGTERFHRLLDFQQGTGFLRLQLWRSAWQMALDHPFFGVGPDNFLYAYRSLYLLPTAWQEPNLNHPHNWPLDWWTRLGLPGLLLALLWFGLLCRDHWQQMRANRRPVLSLGLLAAAATALAHGLIDASYALPDLMIIWVLLTYLPKRNN